MLKGPSPTWRAAALCTAALLCAPLVLHAQEEGASPSSAKAAAQSAKFNKNPAPKNPRDFSGVWQTPGYDFKYRQVDGSLPPMNEAEKKSRDHHLAMLEAGTPILDAPTQCFPHGIPRLMASPYPIQFDYQPGVIVILHEVAHNIRYIHMDGRPVPKSEPHTFLGYSRGHWEGDTLVVVTDHLNDKTQLDEESLSHSDQLVVTEHFRKIVNKYGGVELENIMTIDDPVHYTKPWNALRMYPWRGDLHITEYSCEENNRNVGADGVTVAK